MKKVCSVILLTLLMLSTFITVSAHSGRTDGSGGHYDSSAGEYHYHHGHPAHQHTNGECPYDYDDDTNRHGKSSKNAPWYVVVIAISICCAVFLLDYKLLDGKILMFFVSLPIRIVAITLYMPTLICRLVKWIIKKIKND